jgi:hypothetical protein
LILNTRNHYFTYVLISTISGAAACSAPNAGTDNLQAVSQSLTAPAATVPYRATVLGEGQVRYSVTLPAGQNYVELFVRQNGIQNVAQNIVASGVADGAGTTTYSFITTGNQVGDALEYRFYSYTGPGVFTPGPEENHWAQLNYQEARTFETSTGSYELGTQTDSTGHVFRYQVVTTTGQSFITPYSTGWYLTKASPTSAVVPVELSSAELVGTFVKRAGSSIYDPVFSYDGYAITTRTVAGELLIHASPDTFTYPGTKVDAHYAENGRFVTIPTFIGPQTLLTDATVTFAYLIEQQSETTN